MKLFNKNRPIPIEKARLKVVQFNLSGNILDLSIPENVSPDMPLTELIPVIDIESPDTFRQANKIALMKIMYDFPKPGWRRQNYGAISMAVWLHKKPDNYGGDIFHRENLVEAVQIDLKNDYQSFNDKTWKAGLAAGKLSVDLVEEMVNFCGNTDEWIDDYMLNHTLWIRHIITGLESHGVYCTTLSNHTYLCLDFEYMASSGTYLSDLREEASQYIDFIMQSTKLRLTQNPLHSLSRGIEIEGR